MSTSPFPRVEISIIIIIIILLPVSRQQRAFCTRKPQTDAGTQRCSEKNYTQNCCLLLSME